MRAARGTTIQDPSSPGRNSPKGRNRETQPRRLFFTPAEGEGEAQFRRARPGPDASKSYDGGTGGKENLRGAPGGFRGK